MDDDSIQGIPENTEAASYRPAADPNGIGAITHIEAGSRSVHTSAAGRQEAASVTIVRRKNREALCTDWHHLLDARLGLRLGQTAVVDRGMAYSEGTRRNCRLRNGNCITSWRRGKTNETRLATQVGGWTVGSRLRDEFKPYRDPS